MPDNASDKQQTMQLTMRLKTRKAWLKAPWSHWRQCPRLRVEFTIFTTELNFFTMDLNFFTAALNFFTAELNFFTTELNFFTAELNFFTTELTVSLLRSSISADGGATGRHPEDTKRTAGRHLPRGLGGPQC